MATAKQTKTFLIKLARAQRRLRYLIHDGMRSNIISDPPEGQKKSITLYYEMDAAIDRQTEKASLNAFRSEINNAAK